MAAKTWQERAEAVLAQGCLTYSKSASQFIEGVYPTHVNPDYCQGPYIGYDCALPDGAPRLLDFVCGLGSNLIDIRNNFSLPTTSEVVLAERIKAIFPAIDKLKILKTGTAATDAAVRIARAYTGRNLVWGTGYHGCSDTWISAEEPGTGTFFQFYQKFPTLDALIQNLEMVSDDLLAAVIVEPVQLDLDVRDSLKRLRALCTEKEAVLIFDEVITGFRVPKYSIANYFGIQPDLICLGKALGNGWPIALVGGKDEIMETPGYFISNTHNGELEGIQKAFATLDFLTEEKIMDLWIRGRRFQQAFNEISPRVQIVGYPTRGELRGEEDFKNLFLQEMFKRGYFFGRAWFITHAHTSELLDGAIRAAAEAVMAIEAGGVRLEGLAPRPVFKRNG